MNYIVFTGKIARINKEKPVILLEGKRKVQPDDRPLLVRLGTLLATDLNFCIFRTGNAEGADELFAEGVSQVNPAMLEIILPYRKHRSHLQKASIKYASLEEINLLEEPEIVYQTKSNHSSKMVEQYLAGEKNSLAMKAPYLLRDTVKVIGSSKNKLPKVDFALFYNDLQNPLAGGTGFTLQICEQNQVAYLDQSVWMQWL